MYITKFKKKFPKNSQGRFAYAALRLIEQQHEHIYPGGSVLSIEFTRDGMYVTMRHRFPSAVIALLHAGELTVWPTVTKEGLLLRFVL